MSKFDDEEYKKSLRDLIKKKYPDRPMRVLLVNGAAYNAKLVKLLDELEVDIQYYIQDEYGDLNNENSD